MRMTVRRYRRRRTGSDSLGSTHSPFALPFFDRLEYLSQSINQTRKTDAPFIILVTQDNYFRSGFLSGQSPLVVDIESRASPLIDLLDRLRRHSLFAPYLTPYLLVRADDYDARLFCKAAGPFHVLERQLTALAMQQTLLEAPSPPGHRKEWFSRDEWPILQALSQGSSLRQIAQLQNRPYSRIIYRLSCILAKLGLNHRHELLHLLNNLSDFTY